MGAGAETHSIIDLTLSSPEVELRWNICRDQATGSDHEVIKWELMGAAGPPQETSGETTGWDISGWDAAGMHPARAPPETLENGQGCSHSQAREARLLEGSSLQGDLTPGRDQQAGGTHCGPFDC